MPSNKPAIGVPYMSPNNVQCDAASLGLKVDTFNELGSSFSREREGAGELLVNILVCFKTFLFNISTEIDSVLRLSKCVRTIFF